jgi:hypothetical protein
MVIFHSYISLPEGSQIHSMSEMMQLQGWIATSCCHPAILVCLEACPTIDVSTVSPSEPCSKPTWLTKELGDHLVWAKIPNGPLWETQRKTAGDASTGWFLKTGGIIAIYAIHIYNIYIYTWFSSWWLPLSHFWLGSSLGKIIRHQDQDGL